MFRSNLSPLLPTLWLLCRITSAAGAEPSQVRIEGGRFVGAAGCKSSSCHGGAGEKHDQYITWTRLDFHTRAFAILTNARSARIAETLRLPSAANNSRCTICHSPFQAVPPARLLPTANPTEGISCENCHGAAEPWLRGHTRTDWTYANRVAAGMRDLRNLYVRANTCVACHQNLDADIAAAGHPELLFELDSQSIAEPKHWQDPPGSGPRIWLIGQAVALRELSWRLALTSGADARALSQWNALAWLLAEVTAAEKSAPAIITPTANMVGDFARIQQQADALARWTMKANLDSGFVRRLRNQLAEMTPSFKETENASRDLLFHRAQRLLLALERLSAAEQGQVNDAGLVALRDDVRLPQDFDPSKFGEHLAQFRSSLPEPVR